MKIPETASLFEVYCNGKAKSNRPCKRYLGRFQTNTKNFYIDFTCPNCSTVNQFKIDGTGLLYRDKTLKPIRVMVPADPGVIQ